MNGKINIDSKLNEGTTIYLHFYPLVSDTSVEADHTFQDRLNTWPH
jgi:hypothetical protein